MGRNGNTTATLGFPSTVPLDVQRELRKLHGSMSDLRVTLGHHGDRLNNTVGSDAESMLRVASYVRTQLQASGKFPLSVSQLPGAGGSKGGGVSGEVQSSVPTFSTGSLRETGSAILSIVGGDGAVIGDGVTLQVTKSDATHDGYLAQADWTLFNNKVTSVAGRTGVVTLTHTDLTDWAAATAGFGGVWGAITGTLSSQTDLQTALNLKANISSLATVATTGAYADLTGRPTIPAAQVNSDWTAVSGVAQILNKPSLATVATTGAYSDLSGRPTLGTAAAGNTGNLTELTSAVLTISGTGATIGNATITVKLATNVQSGYLSSADWSTFNSKQAALTLPLSIANGGTGVATQQLAINALTGTQTTGRYLRSDGTNATLSAIVAGDVPTLNQSTSGNAATATSATTATNMSGGTVGAIGYQSGVGASAFLSGNTAATDQVLVSHGTGTVGQAPTLSNAPVLSAANMTAFPTLNQNTTGTASNVTGTVALLNGGTGATTAANARTNLGLGAAATSAAGNLTEATSAVLTITSGTGAVLGAGTSIQVKKATGAVDGYLAAADFTIFAAKQNALAVFGASGVSHSTGLVADPGAVSGSTKFLREDATWAVPATAATAWGSITGTLSSQTDLNTALAGKQATLTLGNLTEATSAVLTITGGTGAIVGSGLTIQVKAAATAQNGYLSSTDWNTFNGKDAGGAAAAVQALAVLKSNNLSDVTAATARTNLAVPGLATINTFSLAQTFTVAPVFTDQPGSRTALGLGSLAVSSAALPVTMAAVATKFLTSYTSGTGAFTQAAILASDVPTLNQNTTGTALNVTGTVAIANGGTGQITAAAALTALGGASLTANNSFSGTQTFSGGTSSFPVFDYTSAANGAVKIGPAFQFGTDGTLGPLIVNILANVTGVPNARYAALYVGDLSNPRALALNTNGTLFGRIMIGSVTDNLTDRLQVTGTALFSNTVKLTVAPVFTDQSGTRTALGLTAAATATVGNLTESTSAVLTITGGTGAVLGSGASIQVKLAATSQSGYLSSTDWNTFNDKATLGANTFTGAQSINPAVITDWAIRLNGTAGCNAGIVFNNTTATTGRLWSMNAGTDGSFSLTDNTAPAVRLTVQTTGEFTFLSQKIRFPSAYGVDLNDGLIGSGLFYPGLNIVGTNSDNTGRKFAVWGGITQRENLYGNTWLNATTFNSPDQLHFGSDWQTWTPTFTPNAGMTVSVSSYLGQYIRIGPMIFFHLDFTCTFGGTLGFSVFSSLPVAAVGGDATSKMYNVSGLVNDTAGHYTPLIAWIGQTDATHINVAQASTATTALTPYAAGLTYTFFLSGFYRCA